MSNTLLSIRIWGYYQLYQCSVFTKSRGNIFVTRLELRRDQKALKEEKEKYLILETIL